MNARVVLIAVLAAVLAGCPKKGPETPDAGPEQVTPPTPTPAAQARTWCQSYAAAYCDQLIACAVVDASGKSVCIDLLAACTEADAVALGARSFNAQNAKVCLDATVATAGTCTNDQVKECNQVFSPAAARGARCQGDGDCLVEQDVCVGPPCGEVCLATGALNQPCPRWDPCDSGLHCDSASRTCQPPKPVGAACEDDGFFSPECDAQGRCDGTSCVALPGNGQACFFGFQRYCAGGHFCDQGTTTCRPHVALGQPCSATDACGPTGTCKFGGAGATCVARSDIGGGCANELDCLEGLWCANGQCAARGTEGQACFDFGDCASGLICDQVLRLCQKYQGREDGESCTGHTLYCNDGYCPNAEQNPDGGTGTTGTCVARHLGMECDAHGDCPDAAWCDFALAIPVCKQAGAGTPCDSTSHCVASDYCSASSACAPRKAAGQPCVGASECLSPNTCLGVAPNRTCGLPPGEGEACVASSFEVCRFPFACQAGVCVAATAQGQPCYSYFCVDGACDQTDGGGLGTCAPLREAGESCASFYDCKSRDCDDGLCAAVCP